MPITNAAPEIELTRCFLDELFAAAPIRNVGFRFWEGTAWPDGDSRPALLVLKHPGALRAMFESGTEQGLAESFLRDDFEILGDIESAFELADALAQNEKGDWLKSVRAMYCLHRLPARNRTATGPRLFGGAVGRKHSATRDRDAVSFHYDVSNDFYQAWLDRWMLYSCAYFERADASLDEAQENKLRHICRKLRLKPGHRLLDIGCGWGGLAIYAARHYQVEVLGVTLSQQQSELASQRVRASGLSAAVEIARKDYRELDATGSFDAIASVGMSEHVGSNNLVHYFKSAGALLRPGGVLLNHAIGTGVRPRVLRGPSFIDNYVFPDSETPPLPAVLGAAETAGLEVRDVENLREHYAMTLRHWVQRLEATHDRALAWVDEATYRIWRLYMAGSARAFARGQLAIYQALLAKPDGTGNSHVPLTRQDWYGHAQDGALPKGPPHS